MITEQKPTFGVETETTNKPTQEEITKFEQEYENIVKKYQELYSASSVFEVVGKEGKGLKYVEVLREYVENRLVWNKDMWQGVIKFSEELKETQERLEGNTENNTLSMSFPALQYMFFIISQPNCLGLSSAQWFASVVEEMSELYDSSQEILKQQQALLEEIKIANDRVAAAHQGFYYEPNVELEKETIKNECIGNDELSCDCESPCEDCTCRKVEMK